MHITREYPPYLVRDDESSVDLAGTLLNYLDANLDDVVDWINEDDLNVASRPKFAKPWKTVSNTSDETSNEEAERPPMRQQIVKLAWLDPCHGTYPD